MIISFDIDNTLIPYSNEFEVENRTIIARLLRAERIRKGTVKLFTELERRGHEVWIYTTSFRSPINLKKTFISYGLNPKTIINGAISKKRLKEVNCKSSKNPKLFGIDIHIDDSEGVEIEGQRDGFKTIIIKTTDEYWTSKVLDIIEKEELKRNM